MEYNEYPSNEYSMLFVYQSHFPQIIEMELLILY